MLDAGHFSSSLNLEFGAKAHLKEWLPGGRGGYRGWFGAAYDRATRIACREGPGAERARDIIASHFREHLDAGLPELPIAAMRAVSGEGYWDAGWRAVVDGLSFSGTGLGDNVLVEVRALERDLRPQTIDECFDAFVLGEPWRHWHPVRTEKRSMRDVGKLAEATGICVARHADPVPYLARAIVGEGQNSALQFARGVARSSGDPARLWQETLAVFRTMRDDTRNPLVLTGLLEGAAKRNREQVELWLDDAVTGPVLAEHFVILQLALPLDDVAMARFERAIAHGAVPLWRFGQLQMGGVSKPVPGPALSQFLKTLYELDGGAIPALQILHMRIFGDRSDKRAVDSALIELGRKLLADPRSFAEQGAREDHGIATIAKVALDGEGAEDAARATCRALFASRDSGNYHDGGFDKICKLLMTSFPRVVLEEIFTSEVHQDLAASFFGGHVRNDSDSNKKTVTFDEDIAIEWVREAPEERASRLAELIPYAAREAEDGPLVWSPFALALIDAAPDPVPVLRRFERRFFTGTSSGPFSGRFVRRRPLIAVMREHSDVRVRNWAREAGKALEENIRRWAEHDRERESRFE